MPAMGKVERLSNCSPPSSRAWPAPGRHHGLEFLSISTAVIHDTLQWDLVVSQRWISPASDGHYPSTFSGTGAKPGAHDLEIPHRIHSRWRRLDGLGHVDTLAVPKGA